jgi:hypothetical protein
MPVISICVELTKWHAIREGEADDELPSHDTELVGTKPDPLTYIVSATEPVAPTTTGILLGLTLVTAGANNENTSLLLGVITLVAGCSTPTDTITVPVLERVFAGTRAVSDVAVLTVTLAPLSVSAPMYTVVAPETKPVPVSVSVNAEFIGADDG